MQIEKAVSKLKPDLANKKILEVACGRADFSIEASKIAQSVHCIDLDSFRLNPKISQCPNVTFEKMDAAALQYGNETFDTAVIYNALAHLETVMKQVLRECLRVVKKSGTVCFISSYSMDKRVMEDKLIPCLSGSGLDFEVITDRVYTYIKISVR